MMSSQGLKQNRMSPDAFCKSFDRVMRWLSPSPLTCDYDDARYGGSAAKSKKLREKIEGLWS